MEHIDPLVAIENWYSSICDGDWEHMARPINNVPLALTEIAVEWITFAHERRNAFYSRCSETSSGCGGRRDDGYRRFLRIRR